MFTFCHFEVERIVAQEGELSLFTISFVSNEHNLWICWVWIIFKNRKFDTVAQSYEKYFPISNCIEFLQCIFHFFPNSIIAGPHITIIYLYKCKLCFLDVRLGFTTEKAIFFMALTKHCIYSTLYGNPIDTDHQMSSRWTW